ncbi:putative hydrolase of the HAD superfamily [Sphingomonas kyeonggiensis]|uniref:Putative hydrolase of the HAD superfamily n=1 Tax=Sphingomonas kyeonggiensis TaxID=1268553 RepID=A0A7W7K2U2_9SPHN|nr:HAD family hydrolase [Sphingomonas kyeonggiensis]MBB4840044.1 putative hydrolase of the HAD superfamily [Sphingomonas kyeonggiensis]
MIRIICVDADDTLWHNMRHFNAALQAFQALLLPFAEASVTQAALDEAENRNRHAYGYGAKGFTLAMIETAMEVAGDAFSRDLVAHILDAGRMLLTHPVELFDGIDHTLRALKERGDLILVTKGDLLHQETKLAASGLGDLFTGVEIASDKTEQTFQRLFAKYDVAPGECIMAGDSMRSDVLAPLNAGAWAAYIPQEGAWAHEVVEGPGEQRRFRQLSKLSELVGWIDEINRTASSN